MNEVKNKLSEMQFFSVCHWCMANHEIKDQALALLKDETCSECGGSGKIILPKDELDVSKWREEPCPKCKPKEPTMHTPCAGESGGMYPRPTFRKLQEPKPVRCPFNSPCVGEAKIQPLLDDSGYYIYCLNCGRHTDTYKTEIEAIIAWNAIAEPKPDELVVELNKAIDEVVVAYKTDCLEIVENYTQKLVIKSRKAADRIEQLEKAVERYQENIDNQYQTIVTQRKKIAELQRRLRTKKEAD